MAIIRKLKTRVIIIGSLIIFFAIYMFVFNFTIYLNERDNKEIVLQTQEEDTRSLDIQLNSGDKKYISDDNFENIRIDDIYWEEIKDYISEFASIRDTENFNPIYYGYNEDGIRFETDLDVFRIYTINREEFYKIPVAKKEEFAELLNGSIYTSFDFIKKYKTWDVVEITYGTDIKKVYRWNFDELAYKMSSKRMVGEIQPLKSYDRSEYNFIIDIVGEGYEVKIETMGDDYVKISSEKGETYYEVSTVLFNYLKEDIFNIQ